MSYRLTMPTLIVLNSDSGNERPMTLRVIEEFDWVLQAWQKDPEGILTFTSADSRQFDRRVVINGRSIAYIEPARVRL